MVTVPGHKKFFCGNKQTTDAGTLRLIGVHVHDA